MIKNIVIAILCLLLLITIYSYYCLSKSMIDYEKDRLEFILNKENNVNSKEFNVKSLEDCKNKLNKVIKVLDEINNISNNIATPQSCILKSNGVIFEESVNKLSKEQMEQIVNKLTLEDINRIINKMKSDKCGILQETK